MKSLQLDNAFGRAIEREKEKKRSQYRAVPNLDNVFLKSLADEEQRLFEKEAELALTPGHDLYFDEALRQTEFEALQTIEATTKTSQDEIKGEVAQARIVIDEAKGAAQSEVKAAIQKATQEIEYTTKLALEARKEADEQAKKIIASGSPVLETTKPALKARDWQMDFGPMYAPSGFITTISIPPQCLFRSEKIIASDTGEPNGRGTRILGVTIGQKLQRPASPKGGTLTAFFAETALGNGIRWDTCPLFGTIGITVSFVQACTFDLTLFGKAVL